MRNIDYYIFQGGTYKETMFSVPVIPRAGEFITLKSYESFGKVNVKCYEVEWVEHISSPDGEWEIRVHVA